MEGLGHLFGLRKPRLVAALEAVGREVDCAIKRMQPPRRAHLPCLVLERSAAPCLPSALRLRAFVGLGCRVRARRRGVRDAQ
eukprot:618661-Prymnesium_polylepis.1